VLDWANRPALRRAGDSRSALAWGLLGAAAALGVGSLLLYWRSGYSRSMLVLWLAALVALAAVFWIWNRALPRIARRDVLVAGGLVLGFAPLYLAALYRWPVQVSSDEEQIVTAARNAAHGQGIDPLGLSTYLNRPALLLIGWGKLGELLGGYDLFHMRLLHALCGLLTLAAAYALFRQLLPRWWAVFASCVLGVSHSFLIISRLAMRENTAVLAEVLALALLIETAEAKVELALLMVAGGAGVALLPASAADHYSIQGVVFRPIEAPEPTTEIALVSRDPSESTTIASFIRLASTRAVTGGELSAVAA